MFLEIKGRHTALARNPEERLGQRGSRKVSQGSSQRLQAAVLVSYEKANSVLDDIVNQWFKTFHWSVPIPKCGEDNETTPAFPLFPTTPDGFEILSPADSALKGKVIERMRRVSS